jgi:hypothetical protein
MGIIDPRDHLLLPCGSIGRRGSAEIWNVTGSAVKNSSTTQLDGLDDQKDGAHRQIEAERKHADPKPGGPLDRFE